MWCLSIGLLSGCVFGLYPDAANFPNSYYSVAFHIMYQSLSKVIWALALCYIIYACETSNGGKYYKHTVFKFVQSESFRLFDTCILLYNLNNRRTNQ